MVLARADEDWMLVVWIGAGALAGLYGLAALGLFLLQRRILFRPDNTRPDLERAGVTGVREVTVTASDGLQLLAWYLPPGPNEQHVVLFLHGNAGNIGHRAYRLKRFAQVGWGVLLLEYRGFGGNPGAPSEAGLLADARGGLAAVQAMGFPLDRILLWGESLGPGLAVQLAAGEPVAAVLLEAPFTSIVDIARRQYPFVPAGILLLDRFESLHRMGMIRAPVLVMHGANDRIIPLEMGRAIHAAASGPKELWVVRDAGHVDLVEAGAIEAAQNFVVRMEAVSA
jgi:fermentation-respiration switch protein FrsA (DUF1100 family)